MYFNFFLVKKCSQPKDNSQSSTYLIIYIFFMPKMANQRPWKHKFDMLDFFKKHIRNTRII